MTSRRSFIAALLAAPMAVKRAVSKVVHRPIILAGDTIGLTMKARSLGVTQTKIIRELWVNLESRGSVAVSIDGEPWREIRAAQSPVIPLRIDLPPWVHDRMPTVTIRPASDEPFKVYGWKIKETPALGTIGMDWDTNESSLRTVSPLTQEWHASEPKSKREPLAFPAERKITLL